MLILGEQKHFPKAFLCLFSEWMISVIIFHLQRGGAFL